MVYYNLDSPLAIVEHILPTFLEENLIAEKKGFKISHCVAWFTTSSNSYVRFEITSKKTEGVIREKPLGKLFEDSLQLIMLEKSGSLGSDNLKIDWRKKYGKRTKSISEIRRFAEAWFDEHDYNFITKNCQKFAIKLVKFAQS